MTGTVDILLATYNGARFLPALLDSLDAQTDKGFRVLVSDDGSTDQTPAMLREWAAKRGAGNVRILEFSDRAGGARGNFARLMANSDADYLLFADQDDVWHPTKVARTLLALRQLEQQHGRDHACLAFCDLRVVGPDLALLNSSLRAFQGLDVVAGLRPQHLLMENVVTGCAMGINAAARHLAVPVPDGAIMHDWWIALCCVLTGHVTAIPEALIDYRQHGGNDVGASRWRLAERLLSRLRGAGPRISYQAFLKQRFDQAAALQQSLDCALDDEARHLLTQFVGLAGQSWLSRRITALRAQFGPLDLRKRAGFLLRL